MPEEIVIRRLSSVEDMMLAEDVQRAVWPGCETDIMPTHLILTIAHNGGLVLGAFEGDSLVAYLFGFLGTDAESPDRVAMARLKHCSHQLGVHKAYRNRGLGYKLKVAQRQAVIEDGIRLVTWTYDPLLSNNAYLNIRRLGAVCRSYIREAYGTMRDVLNMGIPSDRFQVEWWVTSSRVKTRLEGTRRPLDLANFLGGGAQKVNPASLGSDGYLRPAERSEDIEGNVLLVEIPPNYQEMRDNEVELAQLWRMHTREIFEKAFVNGYLVTDFIHLKEERFPRSYYVLSFGESRLG